MSQHILEHLSGVDSNMGGLIRAVGPYGLVLEAACHPFEALAEAVAYQQLHAAAARNIVARFVSNVGNGSFPTPRAVLAASDEAMRAVGFSSSKTAALRDLATKTIEGVVPDRDTLVRLEDAEIIARLTEVRGIGRWTVEMMLMFHLGRPDILPIDDFGVRAGFQFAYGLRKMPAPKALAAYGERWGPFRSAAAWYLWRAVELKKAGTLPAPVEKTRLPRVLRLRRRASTAKAKVAAKAKSAKATSKKTRARKTTAAKTTAAKATSAKTAAAPARPSAARFRKASPKRAYR